jgi:hypothetical protein
MAILFKDKVFAMLIQEGKISDELACKISSWPHSGFNIHNEVQIDAGDDKGKETLAQYIIKAPISQERMIYDKEKQVVIYRSKKGTVFYDPLDWIAAITSHIPNKGAQNVHYYGAYSNKSRGLRKKSEQASKGEIVIADFIPSQKNLTVKRSTLFINKMCEVDPLSCPRCLHQMRIVSIIDQPETIEKILKHLGLWQPQAHGPPLYKEEKIVEETVYDYSFFDCLPS